MPEKYPVTYKSKGKDIELPQERRRDSRLPAEKPSLRKSLDGLRGVMDGIQRNADEYKRRSR